MEQLYQVLASAVLSTCPIEFEKGYIFAEVGDDWSDIRYDCEKSGNLEKGLSSDVMTSSNVDDALKEIRTQMTIPGQKPWSRCTFILFPDGQFKFDVKYDD